MLGKRSPFRCAVTESSRKAKIVIQVLERHRPAATRVPASSTPAPSVTLLAAHAARSSVDSHPRRRCADRRRIPVVTLRKCARVTRLAAQRMFSHPMVRFVDSDSWAIC